MILHWPMNTPTLLIPIENKSDTTCVKIYANGKIFSSRFVPLAIQKIDNWLLIDRKWLPETSDIEVDIQSDRLMSRAIHFCTVNENSFQKPFPLVIHDNSVLGRLERKSDAWELSYYCNILGVGKEKDHILLISKDLIYWQQKAITCCVIPPENCLPFENSIWQGDIKRVFQTNEAYDNISFSMLKKPLTESVSRAVLSFPVSQKEGKPAFEASLKRYRIFERCFDNIIAPFKCDLSFRIKPDNWPDIRILPAEGNHGDITAEAFEIEAEFYLQEDAIVEFKIIGYDIRITAFHLECNDMPLVLSSDGLGRITFHLVATDEYLQIIGKESVLLLARGDSNVEMIEKGVIPITENIAHCRIEKRKEASVIIHIIKGQAHVEWIRIYGIRMPQWSDEAAQEISGTFNYGELVFKSPHYRVYEHCIEDDHYGQPASYIPNNCVVLSPQRVCEEFVWRNNKLGDMVRSINRSDIWRPSFQSKRYPQLYTGIVSVDAAYNISLDTFALNSNKKYSLPGQENMWSSGLFQGEGQSFGVWLRDSVHIGMRCGNLIDPLYARNTLLYSIQLGFDNASDGPALAIVGLWDYYLATGDISALYEAWPTIEEKVKEIDLLYCEKERLVFSPMPTSNDCFEEPENGGYALGSETYYMLAYENMAKISSLTGLGKGNRERWEQRAKIIRNEIKSRYWNEDAGYFTSGPRGSSAYDQFIWESSGLESTIWSRFSLASDKQKRSILQKLREVALCEYGIILYPNKEKVNHFTGSVWGVWQAGFADAASSIGDIEIIEQLIYGQVRNAIINKTFYEVIDADSGIAWRWPGQLWHAAGFISLLIYGVLGLQYNEKGLHFNPAVPRTLGNIKLTGLCYRKARLDIILNGIGTGHRILLDGEPVLFIPAGLEGHHTIHLVL